MTILKSVLVFLTVTLALNVKAQTAYNKFSMDSLPDSEINIPIYISLKPVYALAERNVDTVFTSPNYPEGWIDADCATRYKYHFRRSPLKMSVSGTTIDLSFTGYYQIVGSSRACVGSAVISPWTPSCRCGFDEPERRVTVGFTSTFNLQSNYVLKTKIIRNEPKALDKCEVCFWGQDVTSTVLGGLKAELDASKKEMEDSFGNVNIRPYVQQAWNILSQTYSLPNVGYFNLHPKRLRMENINARNDMLNINIGISASPAITFENSNSTPTAVPDLAGSKNNNGFNIFLEAALKYDSLSNILNGYLANKRFDLSEGLIKKYIIVQHATLSGSENGDMVIKLDFTGSFNGTVLFFGKPVYNEATKTVEVNDLDYDLQTKNLLLKTAKWLFSKKISNELKKYTTFSLADYYSAAAKTINSWLNKEWTPGIRGIGYINQLRVMDVHALPEHLLVRSNCAGNMSVMISSINLGFRH